MPLNLTINLWYQGGKIGLSGKWSNDMGGGTGRFKGAITLKPLTLLEHIAVT